MLQIVNKVKNRDKQCGARSDWSYRSSLIWVHTVFHRLLKHFSREKKQTTFVAINAFRVKASAMTGALVVETRLDAYHQSELHEISSISFPFIKIFLQNVVSGNSSWCFMG